MSENQIISQKEFCAKLIIGLITQWVWDPHRPVNHNSFSFSFFFFFFFFFLNVGTSKRGIFSVFFDFIIYMGYIYDNIFFLEVEVDKTEPIDPV